MKRSFLPAGLMGVASLAMLAEAPAQNAIIGGVSEVAPATPGLENLLQWGPVNLRPHLNYTFTSGNGIRSSPGQTSDTIVNTLSPGMLFLIGDHWTVDYTPSLAFYSNDRFKDVVNHNLRVGWGTSYDDWNFGFSHSYGATSEPLIETARQTDQETHSTSLTASRQMSSKISWDMGFSQNLRFAQDLNSSRQWSGSTGLNYHFWQRFSAGLSLNAGYVDVDLGSDMTFEGLQGRLHWEATDKLMLSVNAGGELRQFLDVAASDLLSPVYSVSVQYNPFENTTFSLSAAQSVNPSYYSSQITESTTLTVGLQQRVFKHFQLGLSGGFHSSDYVATAPGLATTRSDTGFNVGGSVGVGFLKRCNFSIFYNYNDNSSDQAGYGFASHQFGFQLGYRL